MQRDLLCSSHELKTSFSTGLPNRSESRDCVCSHRRSHFSHVRCSLASFSSAILSEMRRLRGPGFESADEPPHPHSWLGLLRWATWG